MDIFIFVHPLAIFGNIFHRKNRRKMSKKIIVYSQYKIVVKLIYRLEYFVTVAIFSIAISLEGCKPLGRGSERSPFPVSPTTRLG